MAEEDNKTTERTTGAAPVEEAPTEVEVQPQTESEETPAEETVTEKASAEGEGGAPTEETVVEEIKLEESAQKINPGMTVRVHLKIKDVTPRGEERERVQIFEGLVIGKKGHDRIGATITVRKVSKGFGVERIFPLAMPSIEKIEVVKQVRVRRSKLYFLRGKYKKRLKEILIGKR